MRRVGRDSPRWAVLERFVIPASDDPSKPYLDRLRIIETPWFALWLHRIHRRDFVRDLHDHPRSFLAVLLRGHYTELVRTELGPLRTSGAPSEGFRPCGVTTRVERRWFSFKRAEDAHAIVELSRSPVWTLCLCGPRRRQWGFWEGDTWVDNDTYRARHGYA